MSTDSPPRPAEVDAGAHPPALAAAPNAKAPARPHRSKRFVMIGGAAMLALAAGLAYGLPAVATALATVSTDDAYVNGHVTLVAPRVPGQVLRVLVDDNARARAGDVLLELDPEPYQVQVHIRRAALTAAEADFRATESDVRGTLAELRSQRWKLQSAMEQVDNKAAMLRARVATLHSKEATLSRARADLTRAKESFSKSATGKQDLDAAVEAAAVADALVRQATEEVREVRVALGLPPAPADGDLGAVPPDLNQTFSAVREAVAGLMRIGARVGLPLFKYEATPKEVMDNFKSRDAEKDLDRIYAALIPGAPAMKQAEAKVLQARKDLDQAELNLRYCRVTAEIDGVVTRRSVNPGNNVLAGQQVMAVRSLTEIWVDANFKETQLADLRIGQRVDVYADAYGARRRFTGRITGFTYGTGSTLALLPPQNATGNFVKVVQRLPVRIEFDAYDPEEETLFAGLSVTPYVYVKEPPSGPNAGRRLQDVARPGAPSGGRP